MATKTAARSLRAGNPEVRARLDPDRYNALEEGLRRAGVTVPAFLSAIAEAPPEAFDAIAEAGGPAELLAEAVRVGADTAGVRGESEALRRQAERELTEAQKQAAAIIKDAERQAAETVKAAKAAGGIPVVEARLLKAMGSRGRLVAENARGFIEEHGLPDTADNRVAAMLRLLTIQVRTDSRSLRETEQERQAAERAVDQLRRERERVEEGIHAAAALLRDTQAEERSIRRDVEGAESELRTLQAKVGELRTWQANLGKREAALQQAARAVHGQERELAGMREQLVAEHQTLEAERTALLQRELARARNIINGPPAIPERKEPPARTMAELAEHLHSLGVGVGG